MFCFTGGTNVSACSGGPSLVAFKVLDAVAAAPTSVSIGGVVSITGGEAGAAAGVGTGGEGVGRAAAGAPKAPRNGRRSRRRPVAS